MPPILIVDDDDAIRTFVSMSLDEEGYEVITARNGIEALNLVQQNQPLLILLDMRMPGMDGRTFIEQYQATVELQSPIIVLTAGRNNSQSAAELNVAELLAKPFDLNDLLKVVERYAQPGARSA